MKLKLNFRSKALLGLFGLLCLSILSFTIWQFTAPKHQLERWLRYAGDNPAHQLEFRQEIYARVKQRDGRWFVPLIEIEKNGQEIGWYFRFYKAAPPGIRPLLPMAYTPIFTPPNYSLLMAKHLARETNTAPFVEALTHPWPHVRVAAVATLGHFPEMANLLQSEILDVLEADRAHGADLTCARVLMRLSEPSVSTRDRLLKLAPSDPFVDLLLVEAVRNADRAADYWPARYVSVIERLQSDPLALAGAGRMVKDVKNKPQVVIETLQSLAKSEHDYVRRPALEALEAP